LLSGEKYTLFLPPYSSISALKAKLHSESNEPVEDLRLKFEGRILEDEEPLSASGLEMFSEFY